MVDWPHAPIHRIGEPGAYFITAATYLKQHFFKNDERLDELQSRLFQLAIKYRLPLQAWSIFPNHYHFIGYSAAPHARQANSFVAKS